MLPSSRLTTTDKLDKRESTRCRTDIAETTAHHKGCAPAGADSFKAVRVMGWVTRVRNSTMRTTSKLICTLFYLLSAYPFVFTNCQQRLSQTVVGGFPNEHLCPGCFQSSRDNPPIRGTLNLQITSSPNVPNRTFAEEAMRNRSGFLYNNLRVDAGVTGNDRLGASTLRLSRPSRNQTG